MQEGTVTVSHIQPHVNMSIQRFQTCTLLCKTPVCFNTILNSHMGTYPPTDGYAETIYCSTMGLNIMFGHMYDKILTGAMHMCL